MILETVLAFALVALAAIGVGSAMIAAMFIIAVMRTRELTEAAASVEFVLALFGAFSLAYMIVRRWVRKFRARRHVQRGHSTLFTLGILSNIGRQNVERPFSFL